jgi:hypothetical protein
LLVPNCFTAKSTPPFNASFNPLDTVELSKLLFVEVDVVFVNCPAILLSFETLSTTPFAIPPISSAKLSVAPKSNVETKIDSSLISCFKTS